MKIAFGTRQVRKQLASDDRQRGTARRRLNDSRNSDVAMALRVPLHMKKLSTNTPT